MGRYLSKNITLSTNKEKCIGCNLCVTICPHQILSLENKKIIINDISNCMECGACQSNCPINAIQVKSGVGCALAILDKKNKYINVKW